MLGAAEGRALDRRGARWRVQALRAGRQGDGRAAAAAAAKDAAKDAKKKAKKEPEAANVAFHKKKLFILLFYHTGSTSLWYPG